MVRLEGAVIDELSVDLVLPVTSDELFLVTLTTAKVLPPFQSLNGTIPLR